MFISGVYKIIFILILFLSSNIFVVNADENFDTWLLTYKQNVLAKGITQDTINVAFKNVKFLEQIIKFDRKQPEFFEDTATYVSKRANLLRARKAKKLLVENIELLNEVENKFLVEKEILLALWGIETNFGRHVGKMDIISSLATLSYDKRRREFFSSQLLTLLTLIQDKVVDPTNLYGSWAGAFGNFQFMPSTIKNYAIDYDENSKIELKSSLEDSFASAANYIKKIGWKKGQPCFYKVKLTENVKKKYLNSSARNIKHRLKVVNWEKKGIQIITDKKIDKNTKAALILPDGKKGSPAFLVFDNYEKILKWNRSLRFGISVCTLANIIKK